jgi:hypothetical protein
MLKRVGEVVEEGTNLLEARAQVLLQRLARTGIAAAAHVGVAVVLSAGVLTLLAALTVWLAEQLGTAAALAISGGLLLMIAGGAALFLRAWWARPDEKEQALLREVEAARVAFRAAIKGRDDDDEQCGPPGMLGGLGGWGKHLSGVLGSLKGVWSNPAVVAGAGAILLSLLIKKPRTLKFITRLAGAAGMTSTIVSTMRQVRQAMEEARAHVTEYAATNGRAAHASVPGARDMPI